MFQIQNKECDMAHFPTVKKAFFGSLVVAALATLTAGCTASTSPGDGGKCGSSKCGSSKCGGEKPAGKCGGS